MTDVVCHVAIADDWEMSRGFGEYEVSTRGVPLEPGGYVRATTPDRVAEVVTERYGDLALPLLRIDLSVEGLAAAGVPVEWVDGLPRVRGPIPMDAEVVLAEVPIPNV
ncbi:hypothetical protein EDF51_103250 [Curtobacterium sp. PhB25]|uniref:DUF952 domain-containing protein n=1 Tax=unclassified Curtobacterium TaxID=257496 RepID=UPI001049C3CC|nr:MULTISPECIES: DUF952 domain-containing protein [unclassified Curtobacterium]TCU87622.1 hypothetical protein EDF48_101465 [Curtobacterium sp. PhB191]TDW46293.1 hypothetical protein EDF52_108199 [Curtobacterium sp. PhB42]TDW55699.1 hypothetical protein EDF47_105329 [Curtobacterium sp. PhB190]TDW72790.1 hypothetical protein EDF51_103250 [Curtobacterium sp. PhB25]